MFQFPLSPTLLDPGFLLFLTLFFAYLWVTEFVRLMSAKEEAFPGPYVRYAWVAAFLFLWMLTPFAFIYWRKNHAHVRQHRHTDHPPEKKADIALDAEA